MKFRAEKAEKIFSGRVGSANASIYVDRPRRTFLLSFSYDRGGNGGDIVDTCFLAANPSASDGGIISYAQSRYFPQI